MKHLPAEWEYQKAIQLVFPHTNSDWNCCLEEAVKTYIELIGIMARFQPCIVVCDSIERVGALLPHNANIQLVEAATNDTWARDTSAITVKKSGKSELLDFTFNGWGGKFDATLDNAMSRALSAKGVYDAPLRTIAFILEGGGIESDGNGTLMTTASCLLNPNRNSDFSKEQIEVLLKNELGIKRLLWLYHGDIIGDDTDGHIDTLTRFTDENTIVYQSCFDPDDAHYEELKAMEEELKSFRTAQGEPYRLFPMPLPKAQYDEEGERLPATYANFILINGAVIVPTYNDDADAKVLTLLKTLYPQREIIGVDSRVLIRQHGSLHCITMNIY